MSVYRVPPPPPPEEHVFARRVEAPIALLVLSVATYLAFRLL